MARTGRPGLSVEQKRELWSRWKAGQSLSDIGRGLGKHAGSVFGGLAAHGGIMPTPRRRSVLCLGSGEREEISRGLVADFSFRQIAAQLGRPALTISREVSRNGGRRQYRATMAEGRAWHQALRPKPYLLAANPDLRSIVAAKLQDQWSPQQISGWLKIEHSHDRMMQVSHETIYKSLFIQARGVLKRELIAHLRSRRVMRRGKTSTAKGQPRGQIIDAISIRQRPADIEDRAVLGHWEGDLISGSRNSHVATLVEPLRDLLCWFTSTNKDSDSVVSVLIRQVQYLPEGMMSSLTWDRGTELAVHKRFTVATDADVFFCDPQSPWQRGSNENTNGLLRQYLPKGSDLSGYSQDDLNGIALKLNTRPRKTLGFRTPRATFANAVASTG